MLTLILLVVVSTALALHPGFHYTGHLEWTDCASDQDSWLKFDKFDITPSPLELPGKMKVTLDSKLSRELNKTVDMDVIIEKELLGHFTKVVCVKDVGTCHYDDPCHFLNAFKGTTGCPTQLTENGLPCTCPFNPSQIKLPATTFTISTISTEWAFLATGMYHIKIQMTEKTTQIVRGCIEMYMRMQH